MPEALNDRAADNWRPLLAIADLAGGAWPEAARRRCGHSPAEEQDDAVNVELLADIKDRLRRRRGRSSPPTWSSSPVADPERPWADWSTRQALTQKQLARLLQPFCITSETVHPAGGQHAKGYKRAPLRGGLGGLLSWSECLSRPKPALPKRAIVAMPMKWAQVAIFEACKTKSGTDRKTATCPTAMRV